VQTALLTTWELVKVLGKVVAIMAKMGSSTQKLSRSVDKTPLNPKIKQTPRYGRIPDRQTESMLPVPGVQKRISLRQALIPGSQLALKIRPYNGSVLPGAVPASMRSTSVGRQVSIPQRSEILRQEHYRPGRIPAAKPTNRITVNEWTVWVPYDRAGNIQHTRLMLLDRLALAVGRTAERVGNILGSHRREIHTAVRGGGSALTGLGQFTSYLRLGGGALGVLAPLVMGLNEIIMDSNRTRGVFKGVGTAVYGGLTAWAVVPTAVLAGAKLGAVLGSFVPGGGTAIGLVLGAWIGMAATWLGAHAGEKVGTAAYNAWIRSRIKRLRD